MCDRHPKWQRVEPGTVVPAGQPYRYEYETDREWRATVIKNGEDEDFSVLSEQPHFVDSSWKPPLVLPTEPTWGIAVNKLVGAKLGKWVTASRGELFDGHNQRSLTQDLTTDFIPLTDDQVARIESAR